MPSSNSSLLPRREKKLTAPFLSASSSSSCSSESSSPPPIPFKPGHLRSISSQVRVQNRIVQAVQIRQLSPDSLRPPLSACALPAFQHGDQPTIRAPHRRPTRESANELHKIMQTGLLIPVHPHSGPLVDSKLHVESLQDVEKTMTWRHNPPERLGLAVEHHKPYGSSYQTDDHGSHEQTPTAFTPLSIPQQAVGLYSFTPDPFDPSDASSKQQEDDSEKVTPEVAFQAGELLEIWVPDIGGGWSLGKNLSKSRSILSPSLMTNDCSLGLIPIGWYKVRFVLSVKRRRIGGSCSAINTGFLFCEIHRLSLMSLRIPLAVISNQNRQLLAGDSSLIFHQKPKPSRFPRLNARRVKIPLSISGPIRKSPKALQKLEKAGASRRNRAPGSVKQTLYSNTNVSERATGSSRNSGRFLSSPMMNASVAVNKEFDANGVHFEYPSRGIACSVTASDAMYAARQAADRHANETLALSGGKSIGTPRALSSSSSSWNPFLRNRPPNRCHSSIAHSYMLGVEQDSTASSQEEVPDHPCTERYEIRTGPAWKDTAPRFTVQAHVLYTLTSTFITGENNPADLRPTTLQVSVARRYSHFELLATGLHSLYGEFVPDDINFVESRRGALERYLFRLTRHPVLRYCPRLTCFLGCEDVEDFEGEARTWGGPTHAADSSHQSSTAGQSATSSSFFSKVFHPDYNVDEAEAAVLMEAYNHHTHSLEGAKGMIEVERNLANLRLSIHGLLPPFFCSSTASCLADMSQNMQKLSASIQRLCVGLPVPHKPSMSLDRQRKSGGDGVVSNETKDGHEKGQRIGYLQEEEGSVRDLRRDRWSASQQAKESDGAMCWKEDCTGRLVVSIPLNDSFIGLTRYCLCRSSFFFWLDCLAINQALQVLGHSLAAVSASYSSCESATLVPVEALARELSFPHKNRKVCVFSRPGTGLPCLDHHQQHFESRKETVLNVVLSELERHHHERNQDLSSLVNGFLDAQIQLHESACWELKEARKAVAESWGSELEGMGPDGIQDDEVVVGGGEGRSNKSQYTENSFRTARSQLADQRVPSHAMDGAPAQPPSLAGVAASSNKCVLDWIRHSASPLPATTSPLPLSSFSHVSRRPPTGFHAHSESVASSAFHSVFRKPLSAAFSSFVELSSDYIS
ncbi:hypothetical protein VP01_283g1 [Puccinia sorghi]|uniref:PX domain-containing protein n=1 Tax=Puccinia sorghi TaxID=27349 RepID=A0A0L6V3W5_9BASI|nr:hypothetical protein VP01_283g1 [Puccinia sorghi]